MGLSNDAGTSKGLSEVCQKRFAGLSESGLSRAVGKKRKLLSQPELSYCLLGKL